MLTLVPLITIIIIIRTEQVQLVLILISEKPNVLSLSHVGIYSSRDLRAPEMVRLLILSISMSLSKPRGSNSYTIGGEWCAYRKSPWVLKSNMEPCSPPDDFVIPSGDWV